MDTAKKDATLNIVFKTQAQATIDALKANACYQPNNESDYDFGLVPKKPIYTLAIKSVDGEKEYLNRLYADNGEKIKYNRRGSTSVDGINGMIDIYDTFLPSGKPYKTIYINMYGAKASISAPEGFKFASDKITHTVANTPNVKKNINTQNQNKQKTFIKTLVYSIIIAISLITTFLFISNVENIFGENSLDTTKIIASFNSVEALKNELKKAPEKYNGKRITVKGYVNETTMLNKQIWLYDRLLTDDELYDGRSRIEVFITDNIKLSVLEDGDYIELNGIVTIKNNEFYLDNCTYSVIKTNIDQTKKTVIVAVTLDYEP